MNRGFRILILFSLLSLAFTLDFVVIGDYGYIYNLTEAETTFKAIDREASKNPFDFFITTGDNVYYYGIDSIYDPHFDKMYSLFSENQHLKDITIYPTLGNHDCRLNPEAQVAMSFVPEYNWKMLGRQYPLTFDIDSNRPGDELGLLMLDGCTLLCLQSGPVAPEHQCQNFSHASDYEIMKQYDWVEHQLKKFKENNILWTGVVIHFPIFSTAEDHIDAPLMFSMLFPLLQQNKVDFYFAGHTHTLQHFTYPYKSKIPYVPFPLHLHDETCKFDNEFNLTGEKQRVFKKGEGLHQFVVGASGYQFLSKLCDDYKTRSRGRLQYFNNKYYSFARVHVNSTEFSVSYISADNEELYKVTIEK